MFFAVLHKYMSPRINQKQVFAQLICYCVVAIAVGSGEVSAGTGGDGSETCTITSGM